MKGIPVTREFSRGMEVRLNGKGSRRYVLPLDKTHYFNPRWRQFVALNRKDGM